MPTPTVWARPAPGHSLGHNPLVTLAYENENVPIACPGLAFPRGSHAASFPNLKAGVLRPDLYGPHFNRGYEELAHHHGFLIDHEAFVKQDGRYWAVWPGGEPRRGWVRPEVSERNGWHQELRGKQIDV